jgi:uncharacterized repeat protein (TIGR03803 family)
VKAGPSTPLRSGRDDRNCMEFGLPCPRSPVDYGWLHCKQTSMMNSLTRSRTTRTALAFALVLALAAGLGVAQTQTFKVLHTFHGKDGRTPVGQLIRDANGNIYGSAGGGSGKCKSSIGCGVAFKMNKDGKLIWQYNFRRAIGEGPYAGLLRDSAGNLFGITELGGDNSCYPGYGCGTVFKLDRTGKKETVLHKFTNVPDGEFPQSLMVENASGTLYGTTYLGGAYVYGSVFSVDSGGKETVLYSFTGGSDGGIVHSGVIRDASGNLFGVSSGGGAYGNGVVFELDATGQETVLYSFTGGSDGSGPDSELIFDEAGNLYGLTAGGGNLSCQGGNGCGVVFELSPHSGNWTDTTLYTFCSLSNCTDGREPLGGPLVRDHAGNIYGVTEFGGTSQCNGSGCGVVFKLDQTGKETVLHSFTAGRDGAYPFKGLTIDAAGNLYGTAAIGGDSNCYNGDNVGCGTLFEIIF